ncbi:MAG: ABC transporter permease, partial [Gemmatimonadales bacterium]
MPTLREVNPAMLQDLRSALRAVRRNPGFAAVVVFTLALGIGANTAIFTVVDTVLLRSLPLPDADQLVTVEEARLPDLPQFAVSPANFRSYRAQNHGLKGLAAFNTGNYTLTGEGDPISVDGVEVSSDFFPVVGVAPSLGRGFSPEETVPGGEPLVVISHDLWLARFGGDARVLDRSMMIDGTSHRIIGVMPAGFEYPRRGKVWLPLELPVDPDAQRGAHYLAVIGRRRPGVPLAAVQREISAIATELAARYPRSNTGWSASVSSLQESMVGRLRPGLLMLLGAVGLVALIACANV